MFLIFLVLVDFVDTFFYLKFPFVLVTFCPKLCVRTAVPVTIFSCHKHLFICLSRLLILLKYGVN